MLGGGNKCAIRFDLKHTHKFTVCGRDREAPVMYTDNPRVRRLSRVIHVCPIHLSLVVLCRRCRAHWRQPIYIGVREHNIIARGRLIVSTRASEGIAKCTALKVEITASVPYVIFSARHKHSSNTKSSWLGVSSVPFVICRASLDSTSSGGGTITSKNRRWCMYELWSFAVRIARLNPSRGLQNSMCVP